MGSEECKCEDKGGSSAYDDIFPKKYNFGLDILDIFWLNKGCIIPAFNYMYARWLLRLSWPLGASLVHVLRN